MTEPVGQADFLIFWSFERRQKPQRSIARVLDDVTLPALHITDVARPEIGRLRARTGVEDGHPAFALDPILPFIRVGVPMHLADGTRLDDLERGSDRRRGLEDRAVGKAKGTRAIVPDRRGSAQPEGERIRRVSAGS